MGPPGIQGGGSAKYPRHFEHSTFTQLREDHQTLQGGKSKEGLYTQKKGLEMTAETHGRHYGFVMLWGNLRWAERDLIMESITKGPIKEKIFGQ